jgi:hypothetical protein
VSISCIDICKMCILGVNKLYRHMSKMLGVNKLYRHMSKMCTCVLGVNKLYRHM